jgi:predicted site-specific integrase-resolvase
VKTGSKKYSQTLTRVVRCVIDELLSDLVSIIYSFSARIYGQRRAKRKTEQVLEALTTDEREGGLDATGGTASD